MTLLLVRHAESEGNVDHKMYGVTPDHNIHLTAKGVQQARELGAFLKEFYAHNPPQKNIRLWCSPFRRTWLTLKEMKESIGEQLWDTCGRGQDIQYDDRLRERSWGLYQPQDYQPGGKLEKENSELFKNFRLTRDAEMGRFYARPMGGESVSDMVSRLHSLFQDIHFDMSRGVTDHLIVTHYVTMQAFAYGFTKIHPRFLDDDIAASNTGVRLLDIDPETNRYADYGLIYDPEKNIYLLDKPARPIQRSIDMLWE